MSGAMHLEMAACPIPVADYPRVVMAHGGGGKLMRHLVERLFGAAFANPLLDARHDGATFAAPGARIAMTTDSYVVRPLFFPGGDIGTLAVNGTVNDLAMCGARARYLSAGFILEEGLPMEDLWRVVSSMARAAAASEVRIVTGDTKVVDRGKGDGIYVNTAGVGAPATGAEIGPAFVRPGDAVLLSGDVGRHGMAVMALREGLAFEGAIESDCAPLVEPVMALLEGGIDVHCLRDATRGGVASVLVEVAEQSGTHLHVDELAVPVREEVRGACEVLGFDPLYVANEGRFLAFVPEADAGRALSILRQHRVCEGACRIGSAGGDDPGVVTLRSAIGANRILDMLSGEQLPRIC